MPVRLLTPYEKNHLLHYGVDLDKITDFGEMPVEYITGFAKFFNQYFVVNKHVLIPRIETEELVEKIVELYKNRDGVYFLEIGTGSGALGLSIFQKLLKQGVEVSCVLTDISEDALRVAQQNINNLVEKELVEKIKLVSSNLLSSIDDLSFDFCVANLPYIPSSRINKLTSSVKDFEPLLALDGGDDGLVIIRRLIDDLIAKNFSGDLFLEVDDTHDKRAFSSMSGELKKVWKDSFDRNRFIWMKLGK